jgi:hypothetical protein
VCGKDWPEKPLPVDSNALLLQWFFREFYGLFLSGLLLCNECCNPQLDSQHHMITFDAANNIKPHSTSEVTSRQKYVINFTPVSIGTDVCKVALFVEVTSSRPKAVFAEKGHEVIVSCMRLTHSILSDNIGWVASSFSIVVSAYVADGRVCVYTDDRYGVDGTFLKNLLFKIQ